MKKGFTLIELIIVIGVIGILASMAIPYYLNYRDKSKVSNFALPIASACAKDAMADCVSRFVDAPTPIDLSTLPNCSNTSTAMGNVRIVLQGNYTCNPGGVASGVVEAHLDGVDGYKAVCEFSENSFRCSVR